MNITSNPVGNYTAVRTTKVRNIQNLNSLQNPATKPEAINENEKKFFMNMYPDNKAEISDYHYYGRDGNMMGVAKGSLFDRRG